MSHGTLAAVPFFIQLALTPVTVFAQTSPFVPDSTSWQVWLTPGYGQGDLDWNIGHPSGSPNILSQLDYQDMKLLTSELGVRLYHPVQSEGSLILETSLLLGSIREGDGRDWDWDGDNRTDLVSLSTSDVDGDHIARFSVAFGFLLPVTHWLSLSPLMGFDYREQHINFIDGVQIVSASDGTLTPPPLGPFPGLDSHYETEWRSLWLGLEVGLAPSSRHQVKIRMEYHLPKFDAQATWNLRTDFAQPNSFEHETNDGHGHRLRMSYGYELTPSWQLLLHLNWEQFRMEDGVDRLHFVQPQLITVYSPLNEVRWKQWGVSAGLAWQF